MSKSPFILVDKPDYPKLKSILNDRLPESVSIHNAVQLAITGTSEMDFYAYNGCLDETTIILGILYFKNKKEDDGFLVGCLSTANPTNISEESAKAFVAHLQPEGQPWRPMMLKVMRESSPAIIKALLDRGSTVTANPCQGFCYPMDKLDEAVITDENIPNDIVVRAIEEKHAVLISNSWKYGILTAGGTEYTTSSMLLRNPSAGVFSKDGSQILSWVACYDFGLAAMLYTPEEYRGRGYAGLVMKGMVTEMSKRGLIPTSAVNARNMFSQKAMLKSGFQKTHCLEYIFAE